jgi:ketosteroid isomerase-like protein
MGDADENGENVMADQAKRDAVAAALRRLNRAWVEGRFDELGPMVHEQIVVALPGFGERKRGREGFVAGHREFGRIAKIHDFTEHDAQIDVISDTAVATYRYELIYEREDRRYRSLGRALWVLRLHGAAWLAVWTTILDVYEETV